jgi:hypothetical protein
MTKDCCAVTMSVPPTGHHRVRNPSITEIILPPHNSGGNIDSWEFLAWNPGRLTKYLQTTLGNAYGRLGEVCQFCATIPVHRCHRCHHCHSTEIDSAQLTEKAYLARVFGLQVRLPQPALFPADMRILYDDNVTHGFRVALHIGFVERLTRCKTSAVFTACMSECTIHRLVSRGRRTGVGDQSVVAVVDRQIGMSSQTNVGR